MCICTVGAEAGLGREVPVGEGVEVRRREGDMEGRRVSLRSGVCVGVQV